MGEETSDRWKEIRKLATHGDVGQLLPIGCPNCGSSVRISFYSGQRNALNMDCLHCHHGIRADGLESVPLWVGRFNGSFFTQPASAAG